MKIKSIGVLAMGLVAHTALAEEPRSDTLDQRLARLGKIAFTNEARMRPVRRGASAVPTELEGKIVESQKNSDGSMTVTTSRGQKGNYDPKSFRPLYDTRRDRTLFGLIPLFSGTFGLTAVKGDGWEQWRTSVGVTYTPRGNAPSPDAIHSSTLILSRNVTHVDGFGSSDSGSGHREYQLNSDEDAVQFSISIDGDFARTVSPSWASSATACYTATPELYLSLTGTYSDDGSGTRGSYFSLNTTYAFNEKVLGYVDLRPASRITGDLSWSIGSQVAVGPNLSLLIDFDKDRVWTASVNHRFKM